MLTRNVCSTFAAAADTMAMAERIKMGTAAAMGELRRFIACSCHCLLVCSVYRLTNISQCTQGSVLGKQHTLVIK